MPRVRRLHYRFAFPAGVPNAPVTAMKGMTGAMSGAARPWLLAIACALLLGCGEGDRAVTASPASADETAVEASQPVAAQGTSHTLATPSQEESDAALDPDEVDGLDPDSPLATRLSALLARGSRAALRQALQHLLEARDASEHASGEGVPADLAEQVVASLIDWDVVALLHDATLPARRDLPLLQRWDPADARIQALAQHMQQTQRIVAALRAADRAEAAGRVVGEGADTAVARLRDVLALDPGHSSALWRLERIERHLLEAALAAAAESDFARGNALLADAGKVRGDSARVQDAAARMVDIREQQVERLRSRIAAELAAGDVTAAEAELPRLDELALDERTGLAARAEIERVRRYGIYDVGMLVVDPLAHGGLGPGMVVIAAGSFEMGSPRGEDGHRSNEARQHVVRFVRGFAMARTETTVAQFRAFIEATEYRTTAQRSRHSMVYDERGGALVEQRRVSWKDDYAGKRAADDQPVVHVSWDDARAYAQWLAEETGQVYRLPTEAEFEYALRAGSTSAYPWDGVTPAGRLENLTGALDQSPSKRNWANAFAGYGDGYWGPAPVASFPSNGFGLNDINGNVSEWVEDCWHDGYARAPLDGSAWVNPGCKERVIRGASWASSPDQARSAFRMPASSDTTSARVGFRVARDL